MSNILGNVTKHCKNIKQLQCFFHGWELSLAMSMLEVLFSCVPLSGCIVWKLGEDEILLLGARSYELYQEEWRKWRSRGRGRWDTISELRFSGVLLAGERKQRAGDGRGCCPRKQAAGAKPAFSNQDFQGWRYSGLPVHLLPALVVHGRKALPILSKDKSKTKVLQEGQQ